MALGSRTPMRHLARLPLPLPAQHPNVLHIRTKNGGYSYPHALSLQRLRPEVIPSTHLCVLAGSHLGRIAFRLTEGTRLDVCAQQILVP